LKPVLFIITGSNGAGKSTVGGTYLPLEIQRNYVVFDGDKLALEKRKHLLSEIKSIKEAKRLADEWVHKRFLEHVKSALKTGDHFAYEGHFRDKRTLNIPKKFVKSGYSLSLIFMGLTNTHESELRVIDRAKHGGHFVPLYEIESNFYGNLVMLNKNYKLFDELVIIDTSKDLEHKILLHRREGKILFYTESKDQPFWFTKFLPRLLNLIEAEEKS